MPVFIEICVVLALTTAISFLMKFLKQPLIVGYILAGILAGPYGLNVLQAKETLELFSKFGVTILLFIIGIHLSPKVIKELGKTSFLVGVGQVIITSIVGFIISIMLGLDKIAALYVSIALTLSSTIIILKLISDKGDTHKLYSKLTISLLIIQDLVATFVLLLITSFSNTKEVLANESFFITILKTIAIIIIFAVVIRFILPGLMQFASKSQDLLFLFSLTWGLCISYISTLFGLSIEVGALVAGVAISSSEFAEEISSKLQPLRDFFIVLFFIFLGSNMILDFAVQDILPILVLSLFVLIGNPVILILIMNLLGYHKKTSYMAGVAIAQISEFSLILATLGMQLGHLNQKTATLITFVGLITISGSSYLIMYSENIYPYIKSFLEFLELRKNNKRIAEKKTKYDVFLFGFNRSGNDLLSTFKDMSYRTAVIDFDPDTKDRLPDNFKHYFYGDASDIEFLQKLNFVNAQLVVSTLPTNEDNILLIKQAKFANSKIVILVYAHTKKDALEYYENGADYVILPHHIGVKHTSMLIKKIGISTNSFKRRKALHLKELGLSLLD